jgi:tetratricopeptide (TPR) repeat protein
VYRYVTPIALPRGTTVSMRYTYDNSAENPRNPQRPPQRVRWGQWANDEMGDLWIQVLTRDDRDRQALNAAFRPKGMAEEVIGYESMIRTAPSRVQLHDDVGVLYLELGRPGDAVVHFEASTRLQPDSAAAHYNLATALTLSGRLGEAIEEYGRALQLRPDYARAHNNLGDVLLKRGRADEALRHFREALRIDPRYAEAHYNAGSVLRSQARWSDAIDHFRRAAEFEPGLTPAVTSLAWLLATVVDAALRNPAEAVVLAERAVKSTGQRDGAALDVLAAAYAAAGRFDRAIETADAALAVASDAPLANEIRRHRALFQRNEPLRSPSGAPRSTVR